MRKRTGSIEQRGNSWRIRYYDVNGIRQAETYGTQEEAVQQLAIRLGELAAGLPVSSKPNTVLFEELAADVITDYHVNKYKSIDDVEARFRLHILPVFGKRRAAQITTAHVKNYIVARTNDGAKPGTINRELEAMKRSFRLALQGRKVLYAPHIPKLREDNKRTGFFTREDVERLCAVLKAPYSDFVMFGFLTGWRYDEIRLLTWDRIDFERNEIRLDAGTTKNLKARVLNITEELRDLLLRRQAADREERAKLTNPLPSLVVMPTQYVFSLHNRPIGQFRKTWRNACHAAGLPCVVDQKTGKPIKAVRVFHDLRRSFAREMDRQGIRQAAIMQMGGWLTDSVFSRYNIVSESDLKDAVDQINAKRPASGTKRQSGSD